jgi:hypothetical protein
LRKMLPMSMSHAVILPESALLSRACFNFFLSHGNRKNGKEKGQDKTSQTPGEFVVARECARQVGQRLC